uniref:Protein white n=1 Tax=Harmonia axyridis TaxID=115357 RepID=A0A2Z5TXL1_HARAX|nr:Protein white [Harmonia axyridis]
MTSHNDDSFRLKNYPEKENFKASQGLTFSWSHIIARSRKRDFEKHILQDVSGVAYPGELLIILGPSGSGKTTLLNCITMRNLKGLEVSGSIFINDQLIGKGDMASISAYVQQDNLFIGCLTVREHLIFQALVRMTSSYSEKLLRVEEVLRQLSLKDCENCQIGIPGIIKGISGGERKRLALASEFLINPFLIFLDEPTNGLDSFMSLNVIQMLKSVALEGRTVIATIHQPSSEIFQLIDKLCLVTEGKIAFLGTSSQTNDFFTKLKIPCPPNFNPADYYVQILSVIPGKEKECQQSIEKITDAFQTSNLSRNIEKIHAKNMIKAWSNSVKKTYKNRWHLQLKALFWRSWLTVTKNPESTTIPLRMVLMESILIFLIYNGISLSQAGITDVNGLFYYLSITLSFNEVFQAINSCCGERAIFMREHNDRLYRIDIYFLSKIICEIPMSIFSNVFITTVAYSTFGSTMKVGVNEYITALSISFLIGQVAQGLGFIISFMINQMEFASVLVDIMVVPLMILGGKFLNISSIPFYLKWVSDLSWFKYGSEALMINFWSTVEYIPCDKNSTLSYTCLNDGLQVLNSSSIRIDTFWQSIGNLFILAVAFRMIALIILLHKVSKSDL